MNKKGFTLVELVVTVAILLTLSTIAVVSVTNVLKKSNNDINTIQNKLIEQSIKNYILDNECNNFCTIYENDLKSSLSNSEDIDISYPLKVYVSDTGNLIYSENSSSVKFLVTEIFKNNNIITEKPNFSVISNTSNNNIYKDYY